VKILAGGFFLFIVTPSWAIMSGNPVDVMRKDLEHNNGQLSLESNFIFESDIESDNYNYDQTEKGEWLFVKGTANINDSLDLYVRLGISHLEHENKSLKITEKMDWTFAFGGGIMLKLCEYEPWGYQLIMDSQYYGSLPDIDSVEIGSTTYTSGIQSSYEEHNIQASLLSRFKIGPFFPYIGPTFSYRDINNTFTLENVEYKLSGKNKNKVGLTVGFDFPFSWEEIVSGTGILSVEGRFIDEMAVNVALTNRF
jgi:hypothetical protein